ncbi:hypothetical protein HD806DRAFT_507659 [Xylariaceae sp. AK1471]|nr:hypothetical protein HD806DRAFT_507659 [Xylariaceae sp. AK1471]
MNPVSTSTIAPNMLSKRKAAVVGGSVSPTSRRVAINQPGTGNPGLFCAWRNSKTRLGAVVAILFSTEVELLLALCALLYMFQYRYIYLIAEQIPPNSTQLLGDTNILIVDIAIKELHRTTGERKVTYLKFMAIAAHNTPIMWYLCLGATITYVTDAVGARPDSKAHLSVLYYGMLLHQRQARAGPTRRRFILGAKMAVFLCLGLMLWSWTSMPGRHRANINGGLWLLDVHAHTHENGLDPLSPKRAALIYALLFLDVFSMLWAYATAVIVLAFFIMSAAICFAWSPIPDIFTVEELRAMVKAERGRARYEEAVEMEEAAGDDAQPLLLRLVWSVQGKLARLGEDMVAFASRQY